MRSLWEGDVRKFEFWLIVEIAVLEAREHQKEIPSGVADRVKKTAFVDDTVAKAIHRRDKHTRHDLNAFVEVMRLMIGYEQDVRTLFKLFEALPDEKFNEEFSHRLNEATKNPDTAWFHDGMTSYDTEEPAMSILFSRSTGTILTKLAGLTNALKARAIRHKGQLMIGRTHGQHAQPITFGIKCLNWYSMVNRAREQLRLVAKENEVMKLSGAVGVYGTLGPGVEDLVGDRLGLRPVLATQILPLDYRARVVNELAIVASILEKIACDLRLLSQTEVGEIREPFGSGQKGSSAMPHKKNPITLEKLDGLASLVRAYAQALLSQIATWHERDIAHSSVERFADMDAFGVVDHMLSELTRIIEKMEVFPERMKKNIEMTRGTIASQKIEMLLKKHGMPAEEAYRTVQQACFEVMNSEEEAHLREWLDSEPRTAHILKDPEFQSIFDWSTWVTKENYLYQMANVL